MLIFLALPFSPPELLGVMSEDIDFPPESPGTIPAPDRRVVSARMAPSHLISSSSLGAQRSSVLLVVTILNVWVRCVSSPSSVVDESGGDIVEVGMSVTLCRFAGRSYSNASSISVNGNVRWCFVS